MMRRALIRMSPMIEDVDDEVVEEGDEEEGDGVCACLPALPAGELVA